MHNFTKSPTPPKHHSKPPTKTQIQNVSRQFQDYERSYVDQDQSNLVKQQRQQQQAAASKQQQQQDEVKQAADEAAKAAQEAAKAAAEASQSLMKGLGGLFGGGQKQAAKPPKLAQSNQAVMQKKAPDPARLAKPCTYGMSPRQRWQWAFRKIQQVTTTSLSRTFLISLAHYQKPFYLKNAGCEYERRSLRMD